MKKIIIGTSIFVGVFIIMVGLIFVVLTVMEPADEFAHADVDGVVLAEIDEVALAEVDKQNSIDVNKSVESKHAGTESLKSGNKKLVNKLQITEFINDSLQEQIKFKDKLIKGYKKTIDQMNDDIIASNNQKVRVKELAKTYESMKTEEMRPILKNVDNETVMAIYKNMNSRTRKNLLIALSDKRASIITELLAKREKVVTATDMGNTPVLSKPTPEKKPAQAKSISVEDAKMEKRETTPKQEKITNLPKTLNDKKQTESIPDNNSVLTNDDINGYRVQLCSGSNKRQADAFKSDAEQRLSVPLYINYEADRFKVRAGNFSEMDSAVNFCNHVKEQGFMDAWVVKSQIESLQLAQP